MKFHYDNLKKCIFTIWFKFVKCICKLLTLTNNRYEEILKCVLFNFAANCCCCCCCCDTAGFKSWNLSLMPSTKLLRVGLFVVNFAIALNPSDYRPNVFFSRSDLIWSENRRTWSIIITTNNSKHKLYAEWQCLGIWMVFETQS